jgi:hypothetical protein
VLDGDIGFFPWHVTRHAHFLHPGLAGLPAVLAQEICRRGEYIGNAAAQVAPAIAIKINSAFIIVVGEELGLANFPGPGTAHFIGVQIATLDEFEGGHQLRAEFFRPAAIPGQGGKGLDRRQIASVGSKISFQSPEGNDYRGGNTKLLFNAGEGALVFLDQFRPVLDAVIGDHAGLEFKKALGEDILGAVFLDDASIISCGIENGQRLAANALGGCLLVKGLDETAEATAIVSAGFGTGLISRHEENCPGT